MDIPLFDLTRQYSQVSHQVLQRIDHVLSSGRVILGPEVEELETSLAKLVGVKHGIGVANGSDALFIALQALGIGQGDLVLTTAYTFFATVSAITRSGAFPVFVDIDPVSFNMDLDQVENLLRTHPEKHKMRAMIPVHLFGQTMDLERLESIKREFGLRMVEDCAQSIGSTWEFSDGTPRKSGSVGDLATFSFFPTKNLGAYGDGGMIVTDDDQLADFCRTFRVHGSRKKYVHEKVGINSRLDELQAAILNVKLPYLSEWIEKRKQVAGWYAEGFSSDPVLKEEVIFPEVFPGNRHVFHQYVVRFKTRNRDQVREFLTQKGIGTSIYYPAPLNKQECFLDLGLSEVSLPETEKACETTLALPVFPEM
ncbi:MAG TPA: DegT/DnrJ/EryC1/StrS family aminotransferase, partial [Thermotogota bacterium]|nr:DegT/DnrJ/EryC1/StrS family aminotransferase [Thermotogota bacterium]